MAHWKDLARQKRLDQAESIPSAWRLTSLPPDFTDSTRVIQSCGILSDGELKLTEITDASVLLDMLARRDLSAVQLTTAFCKRAAVAHQLVNCCTELFFDRALQQARQFDVHLAETGKLVGPLHGLPISIKDGFDIEGIDSTLGWVGLIGKPAKHTGCTAELLYSLGAVIYAKTNIPQSLMMSDSYNHVFGQSVNSLNKNFISGGSSGGEGALVGAKGSVIGIGTDIGGSIRIPAALQGLYGLCPSVGRVPSEKSSLTQAHLVLPVAGPLTTNLNSLELFMESLVEANAWETEPRVLPVPWRKELACIPSRPLKVAFIFDDGVVKPQPPVSRALRETAEKFKVAGHEVVEWDTSSHVEGLNLWLKAVMADGGEECEKLCQLVDEPLIQGMLVGGQKDKLSIPERLEVEKQKLEYRKRYLKHWKESGIDALIMPVVPWVSYKPRIWVQSHQWLGYTALWNLLDFAACSIPATTVDRALDMPSDEWINHIPRNESDAFNHRQYDVDLVNGMPICLQAVTGRFGEEKAIAVAKAMAALK